MIGFAGLLKLAPELIAHQAHPNDQANRFAHAVILHGKYWRDETDRWIARDPGIDIDKRRRTLLHRFESVEDAARDRRHRR